MRYITEKIACSGNSSLLAASVFETSSWSPGPDGLEGFGKNTVNPIAIHFIKVLIGNEKDENILKDSMGE
jgi:hypothetical protein